MSATPDTRSIRRYLLGDLSEADATALERRYFDDPETLEQVCAVENDLVDDHAAGRLEPAEQARFNQHYLASPRHRRRAAIAVAMRRTVAPTVQVGRTVRVAALARAARSRPLPARHLALAAGVFLAVVLVLWIVIPRPQPASPRLAQTPPPPSSTPAVAVETPRPPPGSEARPPVVAAFAISPLLVRGPGDGAGLRIPRGAEEVLLELDGEPAGGALVFTLRTVEGQVLTSGRAGPAGPAPRAQVATVRLPAWRLRAGDYILTLAPARGGDPLGQYFFRVLPR
jgi:hypothetical protein